MKFDENKKLFGVVQMIMGGILDLYAVSEVMKGRLRSHWSLNELMFIMALGFAILILGYINLNSKSKDDKKKDNEEK